MGGGGVDKEQEFHGSWCLLHPLGEERQSHWAYIIKHKLKVMGQGDDQLELGFSLGQCIGTNTGF